MAHDAPVAGEISAAPRLRIGHFLLWMALAGALLSYWRYPSSENQGLDWNQPFPLMPAIAWIVSSAALAGQIAIAIVSGWWRWQRRVTTFQPGEWLAIFVATHYLPIVAVISSMPALSSFQSLEEGVFWYLLPDSLISLAWLIVFASLVILSREAVSWRLLYAIGAIDQFAGVAISAICTWTDSQTTLDRMLDAQNWVSTFTTCSSVTLIVVGAAVDLNRGYVKRWTHWAGGAFWILAHASSFMW